MLAAPTSGQVCRQRAYWHHPVSVIYAVSQSARPNVRASFGSVYIVVLPILDMHLLSICASDMGFANRFPIIDIQLQTYAPSGLM
jgi:hypothetical protein